jgi:hippurate hydrolase
VIAAQIVSALQSIVARNVDPVDSGVITIGHIAGGHTYNVIPETVHMQGTARWFSPEVGDQLEAGVRRLVSGIAESFGAMADVRFQRNYPPTVNDAEAMAVAARAARTVAGDSHVVNMAKPTMGSEDFAFMLQAKQSAYIMMGASEGSATPMLHHPKYDFNDSILPLGASYWATLAEQLLPRR